MFFVNSRYKELPKELKMQINDLHFLDREIYETNKKNKKINLLVIGYVLESCEIFFRFRNKVNKKILSYMEEALGEIPIMFFYIDNLKVKNKIKNLMTPLIDLADVGTISGESECMLIESVYKNLKKEKSNFDKEKIIFKFKSEQIFEVDINDKKLNKEINDVKNKYKELFKDYNKKLLNKKLPEYFIDIINLYFKYRDKSIINLLENSIFFFYFKSEFINQSLWGKIGDFIDIKEFKDIDSVLREKIKQLKR